MLAALCVGRKGPKQLCSAQSKNALHNGREKSENSPAARTQTSSEEMLPGQVIGLPPLLMDAALFSAELGFLRLVCP